MMTQKKHLLADRRKQNRRIARNRRFRFYLYLIIHEIAFSFNMKKGAKV